MKKFLIMLKRKDKKYYKASTLIEALIAIVVAGIASGVLMKMSGNVLQELVQNEKADALTQSAYESSITVRRIAGRHNASEVGVPLFPYKSDDVGYCYAIRGGFDSADVSFLASSGVNLKKICGNNGEWDECKKSFDTKTSLNIATVNNKMISDQAYRFFCVDKYEVSTEIVTGTIVVGLRHCSPRDEKAGRCMYKYNMQVYVKNDSD